MGEIEEWTFETGVGKSQISLPGQWKKFICCCFPGGMELNKKWWNKEKNIWKSNEKEKPMNLQNRLVRIFIFYSVYAVFFIPTLQ